MRVKVESCWGGGDRFYFRLILPDGSREHVPGERWCRKVASDALDVLENVYGYARGRVRFGHR